jgi:hypothetical protein
VELAVGNNEDFRSSKETPRGRVHLEKPIFVDSGRNCPQSVETDSSFRVYSGSLLASVLNHINPAYAFAFCLKIHFNLLEREAMNRLRVLAPCLCACTQVG